MADGGRWKTTLKSFAVKSLQAGTLSVALAFAGPVVPSSPSTSIAAVMMRFTMVILLPQM
jgi:hypothetical protein